MNFVDLAQAIVGGFWHAMQALLAAGIQEAGAAAAGAADAAGSLAATTQPDAVAQRLKFLSWAYTAVWLILAAYLFLLSTRQRRLERQVRILRERVSPPSPTLHP